MTESSVDSAFVLTEKDLIKLACMMVLATVIFGVYGLLMMIFLQWITRRTFAVDAVEKHGISHVSSSRLGGAVIFLFSLILVVAGYAAGVAKTANGPLGIYLFGWLGAISCASLGMIEDLRNGQLSPRFRLVSQIFIFVVIVGIWPELIPIDVGLPIINHALSLPILGGLLTVLCCVGFINAVNMADGANGLMPGMVTVAFTLFYLETGGLFFASLMTSCGLFTIFNVISGRLFLGDAGAYGLGAALALSGLYLANQGVFSAAFLGVLFAYPCIELLFSLSRRVFQGKSIVLPDNDHLHNRIHFQCQRLFSSKTLANSLTGCSLSLLFSGMAMLVYLFDWLPVTSHEWGWVLLGQIFVYGVLFYLSNPNKTLITKSIKAR
ncbi:MAG: MraY family glycosyltransferase [Porticoccaceae bacterium]|nr:MraY family glycosyltransferase [Porticoccaceae bacterium]